MAKRRKRKRRKNPSVSGWVELVAALASLGLIGLGHVMARAEIRSALISGTVPNVGIPEAMIRAGGAIGLLAGGYALASSSETMQKVLGGAAAVGGASFLLAPGWTFAVGLSHPKALTQ